MNLTFAIRAVTADIAGSCVVLGPRVLHEAFVPKSRTIHFQTFDTPKFPPLAEFITTILQNPSAVLADANGRFPPLSGFDPNVVSLTLQPGYAGKIF